MYAFRIVPLMLLGFTFLGCSPPETAQGPAEAEDLASIAQVRDQLIAALNADDVDGIMAGLTDDHLTLAPDGPMPPDNVALRAWHDARVEQFSAHGEFTTDDIQLFGDLAVERWSNTLRLTPRGEGEEVADESKGVWIWKRQADGSWKLFWSIWNSNLPPEGMDAPSDEAYEVGG
jgi:ketosteroid isomerase-like protein